MPVQIWIQSRNENVQKIKLILEEAGQLNKTQKVESGDLDGYMILPTNTYLDEEVHDEPGYFQLLSDLQLSGATQLLVVQIVYIPASYPAPERRGQKIGPIQGAILEWLDSIAELSLWKTTTTMRDLLDESPKRWSVYEPMLLLLSGSFQSATWVSLLQSLDQSDLSSLWEGILRAVRTKEGRKELSHLAINSGIPLQQDSSITSTSTTTTTTTKENEARGPEEANILRTPSGLIMLHGDFGPQVKDTPTEQDFREAFWVTTKQNNVWQVWAPRYTMFSRGNIKEKARILGFHDADTALTAARRRLGREELGAATAVDLYAGIGYFAFSYAALGLGRVWCWEINPWSVEGLRRGCERNGWGCRVLKAGGWGESEVVWCVERVVRGGEKVVVFEGRNERAVEVIEWVRKWEEAARENFLGDVVHVNCGLLPSSRASWEGAWKVIRRSRRGWMHLHENVGVDEVEGRRREIQKLVEGWAIQGGGSRIVEVEHVEFVKTFAPGVWHCVFDVLIQSAITDSC